MSLWQEIRLVFFENLSSIDLSERETGQGVKHVGKVISQSAIRLLLNGEMKRWI